MRPSPDFGDRLLQEVRRHAGRQSAIRKYYWLYFSEVAHQISLTHSELIQALASRTFRFPFKNWCRIVDYQYSNGCSPITQWLDQPARSTLSVLYTPFSQLPPSDYVCSQVRECLRKVNVGGREQLL